MNLSVTRLRYQKKGFRAKLSNGWYVYDETARRPVAGPFDTKGLARNERDKLKGERVMTEKEKASTKSHTVEEVVEKHHSTDQSDSPSAKNTNDGSSPSDGKEEEVERKTGTGKHAKSESD